MITIFLTLSYLLLVGPLIDFQGRSFAMEGRIKLPSPSLEGQMSLEAAINKRRSIRQFRPQALEIKQVSQLLWSAQGVTDTIRKLRAVPSAGACYPLDVYLAVGQVSELEPGLYRYHPQIHSLERVSPGDPKRRLRSLGRTQSMVETAPVVIVIAADLGRIRPRYGDRAPRYTFMEVGHAGQNISLQAVALGLGTVMVGAFDDEGVRAALGLPAGQMPLYLIPIGYPRE